MKFKKLPLCAIIGCFSLFSSLSYSMEERDQNYSVNNYRIQLSSFIGKETRNETIQAGHQEFKYLANKAPEIKKWLAHIVKETGSKWYRTQITLDNQQNAAALVIILEAELKKGVHVVPPGTVSLLQNFPLEFAIPHYWE